MLLYEFQGAAASINLSTGPDEPESIGHDEMTMMRLDEYGVDVILAAVAERKTRTMRTAARFL